MFKSLFHGGDDSSDSDSDCDSGGDDGENGCVSADSATNDSSVTLFHSNLKNIEVRLKQNKVLGIAHQLWPAANVLCNFLEENLDLVCERGMPLNVLELGAGIGLCGLFVAKLRNCDHVCVTDVEDAQVLLTENIELNNLNCCVTSHVLRWGVNEHLESVLAQFNSTPLVIASDCVYWECLYEPLYNTLLSLTQRGCHVIISHVKRWKKDTKFFAMCEKTMHVEKLKETVDRFAEPFDNQIKRRIQRIYRISPKT